MGKTCKGVVKKKKVKSSSKLPEMQHKFLVLLRKNIELPEKIRQGIGLLYSEAGSSSTGKKAHSEALKLVTKFRKLGLIDLETPNPGSPTKYKPEYCKAIVDYFDIPLVDAETGKTADPKFLAAFARSIGVCRDTLYEWCSAYPEFSDSYKKAKDLQKEFFIVQALQNRYNPGFTWRAMMNMFGWREKQEHQVEVKPLVVFDDEGDDGKI